MNPRQTVNALSVVPPWLREVPCLAIYAASAWYVLEHFSRVIEANTIALNALAALLRMP